ncbi:LysM peptidoglycan-binding domain-containing protein [Haloimpatiens lingqiaonensis]|uniref:LysM peptidoglycan-binding domain-containing protein n=1 Tax=Haloimpatiens lingqiaonensis TaxID=1380675 RepID=UPI0010FCF0BF|nr:LysM domain-containing protein [Haloimpatiens lingqiaonensis]
MKKFNLRWIKLYWSKLAITLCTLFIVAAVSYTVYNYLTPINNEELSTDLSNNQTKNISNTEKIVEPFKVSEKDIEKDVVLNSEDTSSKSFPETNEISKEETNEKIISYQIKPGDTLFSISRKYMPYTDTEKAVYTLRELNKIDENCLLITGKTINIPTYDSPEAKNPNLTNNIDTLTYTVKPGDTLFKIAREYMSWCDSRDGVMEIIKLNNLKDASVIKTGQEIAIPCNTKNTTKN